MDRIKKLLLVGLLVLAGVSRADQTIFQPTIFGTGSSLTINSGITTTFSSGSTVNFTGATISGLSGLLPTGGTANQILSKIDGTNYNAQWITPSGGGNVSNSGTPTNGQLALWTSATVIQGLTALPAANFPALTGDVTTAAGSLATTNAFAKDGTFRLQNTSSPTKQASFDLSAITAGQTRSVQIPDQATSTTVVNKTATASSWFSSLAGGVFTATQPAFGDITGSATLAQGGMGGSITASNGGIFYSDASRGQLLAGTATANKLLVSGASAAPTWSVPTFPNASATTGKVIKSDGTNWVASTETYAAPGTSGNIMKSDGTNWTSAAPTAGGNVSNSGTPTANQLAQWTNATTIQGITPTSPITVGAGSLSLDTSVNFGFTGLQDITYQDAGTATVVSPLVLTHNSSGTTAANFGTSLLFQGENSTTPDAVMGKLDYFWNTVGGSANAEFRVQLTESGALNGRFFIWGNGGASFINNNDPGAGIVAATTLRAQTGYLLGVNEFPISSNGYPKRTAANTWSAQASIPNADLANSAITIAGTSTSLGGSIALGPTKVTIYTATAQSPHTTASGARAILVELIGGGGGGGGALASASNSAAGGGGGGGGYAASYITGTLQGTYNFTVGTGGAAGANTGTDGGNGNNTTWQSTVVVAVGGALGKGSATGATTAQLTGLGGVGGGGSTGQIKMDGSDGTPGFRFTGLSAVGGIGGGAARGGGSAHFANSTGTGSTGGAGNLYGGGGGGGVSVSASGAAGGAGADGCVIVTEFF